LLEVAVYGIKASFNKQMKFLVKDLLIPHTYLYHLLGAFLLSRGQGWLMGYVEE